MEALYDNSYGKIKSRKKSLGKENEKKPSPNKKEIVKERKNNLAKSGKDSWLG